MHRRLLFFGGLALCLYLFSCDGNKEKNFLPYYPVADFYPVSEHLEVPGRTFNLPVLPRNSIFYNAGIVPFEDKYLVAVRTETFLGGLPNGSFSRITLAYLNRNFSAYESVKDINILRNGKEIDVQDPRLFIFQNEIYICFNMQIREVAQGARQMYFAKLDLSKGIPDELDLKRIDYGRYRTEKNWTPFEYEGELYFISDHSNQRVFKVDVETGVAVEQSTHGRVSWPYGQVRGGSPAIPLNDEEFFTFFHSSKVYTLASGDRRKIYFAGALTFSRKPPFEILRMTKHPLMDETYYDDQNQNSIIFPTGVLLEGDNLSLLAGKNDTHLILSQMSMEKLNRKMEPIL